jgi:hypothetical protein
MLIFWIAAVGGSIFFALKVVVSIVGGFDGDSGDELDATEGAFKLLTLNSVTGFIAIFGWAGLSSAYQFQLSLLLSFLIAVVFGFAAMLITALLFHLAMKLKSGGERFDIKQAVGEGGEIYIQIPQKGVGKVTFALNGIRHEFDAMSEDEAGINSFEKVVITKIIDQHTLLVRPLAKKG